MVLTMTSISEIQKTPMMLQWESLKKQVPGALLLFRLGDFYEAFFEDASILSEKLGIVLTQRQSVPMSGIPALSLDDHVQKLVAEGLLVAVAEQIPLPPGAKGITERKISSVFSPSTLLGNDEKNGYSLCAALYQSKNEIGIVLGDLSTGELFISNFDANCDHWVDEIANNQPKELIVSSKLLKNKGSFFEELKSHCSFKLHIREEWEFNTHQTISILKDHFGHASLESFGLDAEKPSTASLASLLSFFKDELHRPIHHMKKITHQFSGKYLFIDRSTLCHLELITPQHQKSTTLFDLLNKTLSPMGSRKLHFWITHPLRDLDAITQRQKEILSFTQNSSLLFAFREKLSSIRDLSRLLTRVQMGTASPLHLYHLAKSWEKASIALELLGLSNEQERKIASSILSWLQDPPPSKIGISPLIARNVDPKLDNLRDFKEKGVAWLFDYQQRLRDELGIKTIKVEFSRAFGYFIEVSRGQSDKMDGRFTRRQTLVNAERFISEELKEFETKIMVVDENILSKENELFQELCQKVIDASPQITALTEAAAHMDAIASLAYLAYEGDWVLPTLHEGRQTLIEEGKHPILAVQKNHYLIPNDLTLDLDRRVMLITGPNMAGKSTYLRQTGLLIILAQMGSLIPAKRAKIALYDRIFSRIGASDDLSRGASTFMVEMTETASILHRLSDRSLVLLDEIGRGTGTADGIAIASAVTEYLLQFDAKIRPHVLFATHFSELAEMEKHCSGLFNAKVAIHEEKGQILFTHKIVEGWADKSYGLHVAMLAGLPSPLLARAKEILDQIEQNKNSSPSLPAIEKIAPPAHLIPPSPESLLLQKLRSLSLDTITPLEALNLLASWKKDLGHASP